MLLCHANERLNHKPKLYTVTRSSVLSILNGFHLHIMLNLTSPLQSKLSLFESQSKSLTLKHWAV